MCSFAQTTQFQTMFLWLWGSENLLKSVGVDFLEDFNSDIKSLPLNIFEELKLSSMDQ